MAAVSQLIGRDLTELRSQMVATLSTAPFYWHDLLGKERGGVQTLLEHSLAVFDTLAACTPFFVGESNPSPSADELLAMLIASLAHDAGKATEAWQRYVRGETKEYAKHVIETEIRRVALSLASAIGVDLGARIEDVASCALLHDRHYRSSGGELAEWARSTVSDRARKFADYVNHADSLASASDLMSAERFMHENPLLLGAARTSSYTLRLRGVSSTYLHAAARKAFETAGWEALLFFENGTLFVGNGEPVEPGHVERELRALLEELVNRRGDQLPELAVGAPLGDFLPRPEYVRRADLRALWDVAVRRVGRKLKLDAKDEAKWRIQWKKEAQKGRFRKAAAQSDHQHADNGQKAQADTEADAPTDAELQALRDVGPEACAFKLTKLVFERVLGESSTETARQLYEQRFGAGAFGRLLTQSTYMPVQDYALCVRPWHQLSASAFGEPGAEAIGAMDPGRRTRLLVDTLVGIVEQTLTVNPRPLASESMVSKWSETILFDLDLACRRADPAAAQAQLDGYCGLKAKGRERGLLQCAQCSAAIAHGAATEQTAALGNQGSFSNRRLAFASSGSPPICPGCTVDLTLGQLCVGGAVEVAIAVVPRRTLSAEGGMALIERLNHLKVTVDRQVHAATMDPARYVALSFPVDALRVARDGRPLPECFVRPISKDTLKKRTKNLKAALIARIGDDGLARFCTETGSTFDSFDGLAERLMAGTADAAVRGDPDVRRALEKLSTTPVDFAAMTPNLVFLSLGRAIGTDDDSDADKAILAFAMGALIAREVDAAVAVAPLKEVRTALGTRAGRTVYVPANGPARTTLGGDWLRIDEAQTRLRAIQAAIALRPGLGARSLLEVLRYPSRGFAVRRLEVSSGSDVFWPDVWEDVEALGKVLA